MSTPDLDALRTAVETASNSVRDLKNSGGSPDAIKSAVATLNAAKSAFAAANGGLGVDGKPYEPPLTKAEKKKRDRERKAAEKADAEKSGEKADGEKAAEAPASGEGSGKNQAKKLAKKAAAAEKKKKLKEQAAAGKAPAAAGKSPANSPPTAAPPPLASASPAKPARAPPGDAAARPPLTLAVNPNDPLLSRPVLSLLAATLSGLFADLSVVPDLRVPLRNPRLTTAEGDVVVGDAAAAAYLVALAERRHGGRGVYARAAKHWTAGGKAEQWMQYAQGMREAPQGREAVAGTLEAWLGTHTFCCGGCRPSGADWACLAVLGWGETQDQIYGTNVTRWMKALTSSPAMKTALQLAAGIVSGTEHFAEAGGLEPLHPGMNPLEGATVGDVCTRFPPEPSGYLHIGHAKAVLLNHYYAQRYKGRLIVRFDDTNPSKEKDEYLQSILQDLQTLGVRPNVVTYTSDYFGVIDGFARTLLREGKAFMDDTPQEEMQKERMERKESKHRNQDPQEALRLFDIMCQGTEDGGKYCLRAKIDMASNNGTMRDPVLFRQNLTPHHRTDKKFKAYPTYDLACPIVDSVEGVTHALRTTEYNDRDEQYAWIQRALGLRRVRIHAFSRLDFMHTVLSKRKLAWFVENNAVTGWDDPRFPTVRGIVRRGLDVEVLRTFMLGQGASRRITLMDWSKIWAENKKAIDATARRYMAVGEGHVHMTVTFPGSEEEIEERFLTTTFLPKDPAAGKRAVRIGTRVLLEGVDTEGITKGESIVLMRWGVFEVTRTEGGLEAVFVPDGDFKSAARKLTWIAPHPNNTPCRVKEFDNLISKPSLEEGDDFQDFVNPDTLAESSLVGDDGLKALQVGAVIQLERRGYFRVDAPYLGKDKPLVLHTIPDGRKKAMSKVEGKLAHR